MQAVGKQHFSDFPLHDLLILQPYFLFLWMQFPTNKGYITVNKKKHYGDIYLTLGI